MKALTVYQPWASLIVAGAKPYEFRGWSPRERGGRYADLIGQRIVIHASTRKIARREVLDLIRRLEAGGLEAAATCLHAEKALPVLKRAAAETMDDGHGDLPWGVGLGTAILGEPKNGFDVAAEFGLDMHVNDSDRREHANFGWPMLEIEQWPYPIEARGYQGFWEWRGPEGVGL